MSGERQILLGFSGVEPDLTREQLQQEIRVLCQRVAELEQVQFHGRQTEAAIRRADQQVTDANAERQQIQEALRHSEERLRLALDAGQMGTWKWDIQAKTKYRDATQYALFGLTPDEVDLNTDTFFHLVHPEDLDRVKQTLKTLKHQGGSFAIEFRIRLPEELHGGIVQAQSLGENQGATFRVLLPLPGENKTMENECPVYSFPLNALPLQNIQILTVDDEIDNLELITIILEQAGATVRSASSATEALNLFSQTPPHILVTDIGMPEIDGYMLLRRIRALPPEQGGQLPAIALTAYAGEHNQKQALAAGFQLHMAKPIEPSE